MGVPSGGESSVTFGGQFFPPQILTGNIFDVGGGFTGAFAPSIGTSLGAPFPGSVGPIGNGTFGNFRAEHNAIIDAVAPFLTNLPPEFLGGSTAAVNGLTGGPFTTTNPGISPFLSSGNTVPAPTGGPVSTVNLGDFGQVGGNQIGNFLGIPGTGGIDDFLGGLGGILGGIFGPIISGGGVDGNGDRGILGDLGGLLGAILGGGGDALSGILGGLLGGGGGGGLAGALGGGGGAGGGLGSLLPLLLLGGGLSGLFNNESESKTRVPPPSAQELALAGINTQLAQQNLQAFQNQFGNQAPQNEFLRQLFDQQNRELSAAGGALTPEQRAQIDADRRQTIQSLGFFENPLGAGLIQDFQSGGRATPDQLANIQGAADATIERGLSDLGRFRDEGLNQARINSANRGLRPSDTPIQNNFADIQNEANRNAQNFVSGVRQQQFLQNLNFPLAAQGVRLGQFNAGLDASFRRRQLEETLAQAAQQQRLGLAGGAQQGGLGLIGSFNPISAQGAATATRTGNVTNTSTPGTLDTLSRIFQGLGTLAAGQQR